MTARASLKEINRIALPAIFAGIAEPLISLGDIAIVGRIPHDTTEVLAAVGIAGSFISALIWILAQTKAAVSAVVSQYLGANKLTEIKSLVPQTILLSFILSAVVYLTTSLLAIHIFKLYNASGLILDYAVDYFQIRAFGFPFTLVTFAIFGVLRGLQDTLYAMYISLAGGVLNLVLDVVLVFGVGEVIPPMGVAGAAYASLVAQFAMTLAAVWVLHARTPFSFKLSFTLHPELRRIISLSANLVVRTAALNVALYLANRYATGYGRDHIATHTIALNIWLFAAFFIDGYANAGIAIAGKMLGAKEHRALGRLGYDLSRYSVIVALCVSLVFIGAYPWLGGLFITDPAVLSLFSGMFWMIIVMQPLNALAFTFDGIYKGLGEARFLRNLLLFATFGVFVPAIMLFDHLGLGLHGIWGAFIAWMAARSLILVRHFYTRYGA